MKHGKKLISLLLPGVLLAVLAGCGSSSGSPSQTAQPSGKTETPAAEKTPSGKEAEGGTQFYEDGTAADVILADEDGFKITAKSLAYEKNKNRTNMVLTLTLENKSGHELEFTTSHEEGLCNTVNGYSSYYLLNGIHETVAPGESLDAVIDCQVSRLLEYGIRRVADMQLGFEVDDDESNKTVFVQGHLETAASGYDYANESIQPYLRDNMDFFTDGIEYDTAGLKVLSAAFTTNDKGRSTLYLEIENTTDEDLWFDPCSYAVNGLFGAGHLEEALVPAGKKALSRTSPKDMLDFDIPSLKGMDEVRSLTIVAETRSLEQETLGYGQFALQFAVDGEDPSWETDGNVSMVAGPPLKIEAVHRHDDENGAEKWIVLVITNESEEDLAIDMFYEGKINYVTDRCSEWGLDILPAGQSGRMFVVFSAMADEVMRMKAEDITDVQFELLVSPLDEKGEYKTTWHVMTVINY